MADADRRRIEGLELLFANLDAGKLEAAQQAAYSTAERAGETGMGRFAAVFADPAGNMDDLMEALPRPGGAATDRVPRT
jgi:hypothetical protein